MRRERKFEMVCEKLPVAWLERIGELLRRVEEGLKQLAARLAPVVRVRVKLASLAVGWAPSPLRLTDLFYDYRPAYVILYLPYERTVVLSDVAVAEAPVENLVVALCRAIAHQLCFGGDARRYVEAKRKAYEERRYDPEVELCAALAEAVDREVSEANPKLREVVRDAMNAVYALYKPVVVPKILEDLWVMEKYDRIVERLGPLGPVLMGLRVPRQITGKVARKMCEELREAGYLS